jgi:hypothetical protein
MKDLATVEPRTPISASTTPGDNDATPSQFKISTSGSYYLTQNLLGVPGKIGIEIAASNVMIDLNGFSLNGVQVIAGAAQDEGQAVAGSSDEGIRATGLAIRNIAVRNGIVNGWTTSGIDLSIVENGSVEKVEARNNAGTGIRVGTAFQVISCTATANTIGIHAFDSAVIKDCVAKGNSSIGIEAFQRCVVSHCSATWNGGDGIAAEHDAVITNCTSSINDGDGIEVDVSCLVLNNTCAENGVNGNAAGIHVQAGDGTARRSRIEGNNVTFNDRGIDVDGIGNLIIRNSAGGNGTEYDIAPGNTAGPVITAATIGTNSNPHANYDY